MKILKLLLEATKANRVIWTNLSERGRWGDIRMMATAIKGFDVRLLWNGAQPDSGACIVRAEIYCNGHFICHSNDDAENDIRSELWHAATETAISRQDVLKSLRDELELEARENRIASAIVKDDE